MIEVIEYANIKEKLIEFQFDDNQPDNAMTDYVASFDIFPVVLISKSGESEEGITIPPQSIQYIKLYNNKFLPEIDMTCLDETGSLIDDFFPTDYDIILSIFVKSTSEETLPIRMDFRTIDYNPLQLDKESSEKKFRVRGILDIEPLHYTFYESFSKQTSFEVLKEIALNMGLGFATNIQKTNDSMTWINPADTYLKFIQEITERAYISDDSFVWSFIDFYYNLNFVDIEKELNESPKELQSLSSLFKNSEEEQHVELYLSTSDNIGSTNKYISKYNLNNKSFNVNLSEGYQYSNRWFSKTKNTIYQTYTKENETQDDNLIQLITNKDISYYNYNGSFLGKLDEDNVHKNYHTALTINEFNISKLHKVTMVVTLQLVNFEIRRFQKIMVDFYDTKITIEKNKDDTGVKEKISGYWFVTGINYNFNRSGGATQEITMVRRDLNISHKELHDIRSVLNNKK